MNQEQVTQIIDEVLEKLKPILGSITKNEDEFQDGLQEGTLAVLEKIRADQDDNSKHSRKIEFYVNVARRKIENYLKKERNAIKEFVPHDEVDEYVISERNKKFGHKTPTAHELNSTFDENYND